jgi:hypothetical protein
MDMHDDAEIAAGPLAVEEDVVELATERYVLIYLQNSTKARVYVLTRQIRPVPVPA